MLADWAGLMCFWSSAQEMTQPENGRLYEQMRQRFPNHLLLVSEFANLNPDVLPDGRGMETLAFYQQLCDAPGYGAAFADILSAPNGYNGLTWRDEQGRQAAWVAAIGRRK